MYKRIRAAIVEIGQAQYTFSFPVIYSDLNLNLDLLILYEFDLTTFPNMILGTCKAHLNNLQN